MDTVTIKPRKFRPSVVEALLAEVATLDEAAVMERMMPAGCYTEPAFFDFEQKEVFARTWICVGRVEQVAEPGDCLATEVAGEPVLVVRGEDGTIRALSAICQHRGEIIPCPEKGKALRCPLHFWTYDFQRPPGRRAAHGRRRGGAAAAPDGAAADAAPGTVARLHLRQSGSRARRRWRRASPSSSRCGRATRRPA